MVPLVWCWHDPGGGGCAVKRRKFLAKQACTKHRGYIEREEGTLDPRLGHTDCRVHRVGAPCTCAAPCADPVQTCGEFSF
eukprot:scaffold10379_cov129-Isochrysis_galbana.AAC.1